MLFRSTGNVEIDGAATIAAGTLGVNGALIAGGTTTVLAGATLSGTDQIGDLVVYGIHSPGNSPGVQTTGVLTYAAGSSVIWQLVDNTTLGRGTNYDGVNVGGDLTFSGSTSLALSFNDPGSTVNWTNPFWDVNQSWTVFNQTGGGNVTGLGSLSLGGSLLDSQGQPLDASRGSFSLGQDGSNVLLLFTAVPEPSSLALLVTASMSIGLLCRRRLESEG